MHAQQNIHFIQLKEKNVYFKTHLVIFRQLNPFWEQKGFSLAFHSLKFPVELFVQYQAEIFIC